MVIFFDIDDTLIDSETAHLKAIKMLCFESSIVIENESELNRKWIAITKIYLAQYFKGKLSLEEQRTLRLIKIFAEFGKRIFNDEAKSLYNKYHTYFLENCIIFPDVIPTLKKLKAYELGIISNGTYSDQIYKLQQNRILPFFNPVIVSEKVGFTKPAEEIFLLAAREAGTVTSKCIYIGNDYQADYQGSINAGMQGVWLDRNRTMDIPDCENIFSLAEITPLINK